MSVHRGGRGPGHLCRVSSAAIAAATSVAVLTSTNGTSKNSNATVSGGNLSYSAAAQGAYQPVRATIVQQSNLAQLEFTVTAVGSGFITVGYDDGTASFASFTAPGITTATGIGLQFNNAADIAARWNTDGNNVVFVTGLNGANASFQFAVGDTYTLILDEVAHTLALWRTRSGSTVQIGSTATGLPTLSSYFNYVAAKNGEAFTVNYGASAFSKALSGDTYYG